MKTRVVFEKMSGGMWFVDYLSTDGKSWKNYSSSKSYDFALKIQEALRGKNW